MVRRGDYWFGILVIALALLVHGVVPRYLPRYSFQHFANERVVLEDRWRGVMVRASGPGGRGGMS